jgi:KTSC domain-containing protein
MPIESWDTPHSSNVSSVSYNPETKEMTVSFKSGGSYTVSGVEATTASDMANDPSPGSYYNRHIRNSYNVRKL